MRPDLFVPVDFIRQNPSQLYTWARLSDVPQEICDELLAAGDHLNTVRDYATSR